MIGDAIKNILSGVTSNVNPSLIPHNRASQWVIYHQASRIPTKTKTDGGNYDQYRFQLDVYARTYSDTDTLAAKVKTTLDRYNGTVEAIEIDHIFFDNETESWETIEEEHYHRKIQDYIIFIKSYGDAYGAVYNKFTVKPSEFDLFNQNKMLAGLVDLGVYAKAELIDIFSLHAEQYLNWKSPGTFDPSGVNSPAWTQYAGVTGAVAGTKYVRLNFIPGTDGTLIGQNNICLIVGVGSNVAEDTCDVGGNDVSNSSILYISSRLAANSALLSCNSAVGDMIANTNSKQHFAMSRNAAANFDYYFNTTKTNLVKVSSALCDVELFACCYNNNGTPYAIGSRPIRYVILASYLTETEVTGTMNIMETYLKNYSMGLT